MLIDFDLSIVLGLFIIYAIMVSIFKIKCKKSNGWLVFFSFVFIYLSGVLNYTQFPIMVFVGESGEFQQNVFKTMNWLPLLHLTKEDVVTSFLNVILAVPYGVLLPFFKERKLGNMILHGIIFGVVIEGLQFLIAMIVGFTMRVVDVNDMIFNLIGVLLGYYLYKIVMIVVKKAISRYSIPDNFIINFMLGIK